jgi:ubiquitin-protein ligase
MFNIQKRLKAEATTRTVDLRQRLLQKEFEDLKHLPNGCSVQFDNPDVLYNLKLIICPDRDSYWNGGTFEFIVQVPESYNFEVNI